MSKGVGIFIGPSEVIAVSAVRAAAGPQITSFVIEPINSEGPQEPVVGKEANRIKKLSPEGRAVLKALEKIKEPGAYVTAAVSSSQVATRQFMMPAVPAKEEPGAVRFEAGRYIPFKIADSVLDYHIRLVHKNVSSVTVTAIPREVVATCLQTLRAVSVKALMIEPAYCAVSRVVAALNLTGKSKTQGFVVLQSDGNVNVTLSAQGIIYLSRDFHLSGEINEDKKHFQEEIETSISYFYKMTGGTPVEHIFLTGSGDLKKWVEHLEHAFNYAIRFDIPSLSSAKNIPQETFNTICVAFGLALRDLNYHSPLGDVQLLPREHRRSGFRQMLNFLVIQNLSIFFLLLLIRIFVLQPNLVTMNRQHHDVMEAASLEDPTIVSQTTPDLLAKKNELQLKAKQLKEIYEDPVLFSSILKAIGQGLPNAISLEGFSFGFKEGSSKDKSAQGELKLNANGVCYLGSAEKETEVVSGWVKFLAARKTIRQYFAEVKVVEIKREKKGDRELTRFRIVGE